MENPDRTPTTTIGCCTPPTPRATCWGEVGSRSTGLRGEWQISRVYCVLGRAEPALAPRRPLPGAVRRERHRRLRPRLRPRGAGARACGSPATATARRAAAVLAEQAAAGDRRRRRPRAAAAPTWPRCRREDRSPASARASGWTRRRAATPGPPPTGCASRCSRCWATWPACAVLDAFAGSARWAWRRCRAAPVDAVFCETSPAGAAGAAGQRRAARLRRSERACGARTAVAGWPPTPAVARPTSCSCSTRLIGCCPPCKSRFPCICRITGSRRPGRDRGPGVGSEPLELPLALDTTRVHGDGPADGVPQWLSGSRSVRAPTTRSPSGTSTSSSGRRPCSTG